jgi:hypothetical protein
VENGFTVEHQVIRQADVIRRQQIIRHIGNTHADAENHHQLRDAEVPSKAPFTTAEKLFKHSRFPPSKDSLQSPLSLFYSTQKGFCPAESTQKYRLPVRSLVWD